MNILHKAAVAARRLMSKLGLSMLLINVALAFIYFLLFFLTESRYGLGVAAVISLLISFTMVRLVLFTAGHISINGRRVNAWTPVQQVIVTLFSLLHAIAYFLVCLACIAQIGQDNGIIVVGNGPLYPTAFSAVVSNIIDADPRIFGVGTLGVALVSALYILKFCAVALFLPALIAVLLEVRDRRAPPVAGLREGLQVGGARKTQSRAEVPELRYRVLAQMRLRNAAKPVRKRPL